MFQRDKIVAAIEHKRAAGMTAVEAVTDYVRDAAFTTLNRFVALKMLEARELVQECITKGEQSTGYREFCGMAPGLALLPDAAGYRLYIECLFDELSTEIKVLFDRRDAASVSGRSGRRSTRCSTILNGQDLQGLGRGRDDRLGLPVLQQRRRAQEDARGEPGAAQQPRTGRAQPVLHAALRRPVPHRQHAGPDLARDAWRQTRLSSAASTSCAPPMRRPSRAKKDPRDLRILDPACGSGHFLLYSFDLLLAIYEEAWEAEVSAPKVRSPAGRCARTTRTLTACAGRRRALILEHNLYGVDIDPRCAQIAALALWLRAQRAWKDFGVAASERPRIRRTHIVVAEPMPGDAALVEEFAARLDPPLLRDLFKKMVGESRLAGELGTLLRVEDGIAEELGRAREQFVKQRQTTGFLPGLEPAPKQGHWISPASTTTASSTRPRPASSRRCAAFAETANGSARCAGGSFADDAAQGIALIDLARTRFDVVLMNPPFGAGSLAAKKEFEKGYPRTKNDVYAAFVERGIQLLHPHGLLGAITSRTGFFLSSFQKWREEILLKEAPPVVFADLGYGVLDSAMVEVAAYCLEKGGEVAA